MVGQGKGGAGGECPGCNCTGTDIGSGKGKCLATGKVAVQHKLVGGAGVGGIRAKADDIAIVFQLNPQAFGGGAGQWGKDRTVIADIIVVGKSDIQVGGVGAVNRNAEWCTAGRAANGGKIPFIDLG